MNPDLIALCSKYQLSVEFMAWVEEKKLSLQDLAPLRSWTSSSFSDVQSLCDKIATNRLSKSSGTQALELGIELLLIGHSWQDLSNIGQGNTWVSALREKRYPQTTQRDSMRKEKWLQFSWPKGTQVRWARHGDLSGVEAKFFISHVNEIDKIIRALENVKNEMHKG